METALDVLSRAATMVQDKANEARISTKELPTAKWRRDRRLRASEYHASTGVASTTNSNSPPMSPPLPKMILTPYPPHPNVLLHGHSQQQPQLSPLPHHLNHHHNQPPHHTHHLHAPPTATVTLQQHQQQQQQQSQQVRHPPELQVPLHHLPVPIVNYPKCSSPPVVAPSSPLPSASMTSSLNALSTAAAIAAHNTSPALIMAAAALRPLCEPTNRTAALAADPMLETPLDMSVSSSSMRQRSSPPPPYREPLPGSLYANSLARPSVITQAPSKCESRDGLLSNREIDNRSTESISMCETVIDEHFRRSLGPDYLALFSKKSPTSPPTASPSPQPSHQSFVSSASTTTPPLPPPPQAAHHPIYHAPAAAHVHSHFHAHAQSQPQALISPKPTAMLLSPAAMAAQARAQSLSPHLERAHAGSNRGPSLSPPGAHSSTLPPPQQQPLSLHRSSSPPHSSKSSQRMSARPLPPPAHSNSGAGSGAAAVALQNSPSGSSPHHSTPTGTILTTATATVSGANLPPSSIPPIMRIKAEPGLASAAPNTPPVSPTSSSCASSSNASASANSDVLASVDDHFAKALGDTWTKLKKGKGKDLRK